MDENQTNNEGLGDERDPMYPDTTANDGAPKQPEQPSEPKEPESVADAISQRLSGEAEAGQGEGVAEPENPVPFDVTKLSRDQLQYLKQMLAATPDTQKRKKSNPKVFLRRIDDKIVSDYKRAYLALVNDPENNRKVERHVIPIKFFGESTYQDVLYSQFINSERVACEVIQTRQQVEEYVEGETISRETGLPVEMVRKEVKYWFTVKLPSGETAEIEARLANA